MKNINEQNQALFAEVLKLQITNTKINWSDNSLIWEFYQNVISKRLETCTLSTELLAIEPAVDERIETWSKIDNYIDRTVGLYRAFIDKDYPKWLIRNSTDQANFKKFFENIDSITDQNFFLNLETYTAYSIESLWNLYSRWLELLWEEKLNEQKIDLIRNAIDLRNYLKATLRLFGYGPIKIGEVLV